jgi:hypothetical protein
MHSGKDRSRLRGIKDCVKGQEPCMDDITRIQAYFARKAKAVPTHRFKDLYVTDAGDPDKTAWADRLS